MRSITLAAVPAPSVRFVCAAFMALCACSGPAMPMDASIDARIDAGRDSAIVGDAGPPVYTVRSCDLTVRYAPPVGVTRMRIAGEFTDWATAPLEMRDDDGDGSYEITLSPSARLQAGQ